MNASLRRLFVMALCASPLLSACAVPKHADADGNPVVPLGREEALTIARRKAIAEGFDLAKYRLDTFAGVRDEAATEWSFVFLCAPAPSPPGCYFSVAVDRRSGNATLYRGE